MKYIGKKFRIIISFFFLPLFAVLEYGISKKFADRVLTYVCVLLSFVNLITIFLATSNPWLIMSCLVLLFLVILTLIVHRSVTTKFSFTAKSTLLLALIIPLKDSFIPIVLR